MISPRSSASISLKTLLFPALAVLLAFGVSLHTAMQDGVWADEVWSLWAVEPDTIAGMLARIGADYHPPLYFLLLQGWLKVSCQSPLCLRFPSLLAGTLAAAATWTIGRKLFNSETGLIAVTLLAGCGFFRYYSGEARMYSLLLLVSALCMIAFLAWLARPDLRRTLIYGTLIAALVYTHYHGIWLLAAQAAYVLIFRRDQTLRWPLPSAVGLALFAPWIPVLIGQIGRRPPNLVEIAAPTNLDTLRWIVWMMSGGIGLALLLPYLLGPDINALRRHSRGLALCCLWLFGVPALMLVANAAGGSFFYHPRYLIGILPAGVLLIGFGIGSARWRAPAFVVMGLVLGLWISQYREFWPSRSIAYSPVFAEVTRGLEAGEPFIVDIDPNNLVSYYDKNDRMHLQDRAALDLTGSPDGEVRARAFIADQAPMPVLWLVVPTNKAQSWALMSQVTADHHPTYGGSVQNMLFYRFEAGGKPNLRYRFGESLDVRAALSDGESRLTTGDPFCITVNLKAARGLDGSLSMAVHLVDAAGQSAAQWDGGLEAHSVGEAFSLTPCIGQFGALPPGEYEAQVTVYNWQTHRRLPLAEVSTGTVVGWGDTLVAGMVSVAH